jgi:hypothetical protein
MKRKEGKVGREEAGGGGERKKNYEVQEKNF